MMEARFMGGSHDRDEKVGKTLALSSRNFSGVPKYCRPGLIFLRCMLKGGIPGSLSFRVMDCEALPSMP